MTDEPPKGIFYNRMSASAFTRGHSAAPALAASLIEWLEAHDRIVINGSRALALEISKTRQFHALRRAKVRGPETVSVVGRDDSDLRRRLVETAKTRFSSRTFMLKHNCGGKGVGVRRFESVAAFAKHLHSADFVSPIDGVALLQTYIEPVDQHITRCEFVG